MTTNQPSVQIIKASHELQRRIGSGPINESILTRCQDVMDNNDTDFAPIAIEFLNRLERALEHESNQIDNKIWIHELTTPVMELKANASMFKYDLVTNLANIMLGFLETISTLDKDAVAIVGAHHRTLYAIIERKMTGDGGTYGYMLMHELKDACNRYFIKRGMKPLGIAVNPSKQ